MVEELVGWSQQLCLSYQKLSNLYWRQCLLIEKTFNEISDIGVFLYNQTFYLGSSKQSSYMQKNMKNL